MENKGRNHFLAAGKAPTYTVHILTPLLGTGQFHTALRYGPKAARLDMGHSGSFSTQHRQTTSQQIPFPSAMREINFWAKCLKTIIWGWLLPLHPRKKAQDRLWKAKIQAHAEALRAPLVRPALEEALPEPFLQLIGWTMPKKPLLAMFP